MSGRDLSAPGGRRAAWLNSLFVDHALLRLGWRNWGVVESGRLYRSNHPTPWQLEQAVRRHGIGFVPYSPLGRGFLTGEIKSPEDFDANDWRRTNPRFQGEAFAANLALVAKVQDLAKAKGVTLS